MATATKKPFAATPNGRGASGLPSLKFRVYRDNGGDYHWEIVGGNGAKLAQSAAFASHDDAETRSASRVRRRRFGPVRVEPEQGALARAV